jgi:glycosyltransferase involved in cell wall biosynthesis
VDANSDLPVSKLITRSVPPQLTVAICSHAGEERLRTVLLSLVEQTVDPDCFRVLIIDNASPVPLRPMAEEFSTALDVRVVSEPVLGLAMARNRALDETDTPIVVFLDDDVTASEGLIAAYDHAFASDIELLAAGGPIRFEPDRRPPAWVRGPVRGLLSIQDLGAATDYGAGYPYGANMAFRIEAITHPFSTSLGRVGKNLLSGEEALFFRLNAFGAVAHIPEACVFHHVAEERMRLPWLARRAIAQLRTRRAIRGLILGD